MEIKAVEEKKSPSKKMKAGISSLAVGLTLIQKAKARPPMEFMEFNGGTTIMQGPSFQDYFGSCTLVASMILFILGIVITICTFLSKIFEHFLSKHYDEKNDTKYKRARKNTKELLMSSIICFSIGIIFLLLSDAVYFLEGDTPPSLPNSFWKIIFGSSLLILLLLGVVAIIRIFVTKTFEYFLSKRSDGKK